MKEFKCRCSAIGQIMSGTIGLTEAQTKTLAELLSKPTPTAKQQETISELLAKKENKELPQTAKTYVEIWVKEQLYSSKKEFSSKQTQKGNECEDESIDFIADMLGLGMLMKNNEYFENDFITGTPDVLIDYIIDVKNSWDCFTFPLFANAVPNQDYDWQLTGYMWLTGKTNAKLIYVLSDTPAHLIEKEAYYYCKSNGYDELDMDVYLKFVENMTYKNVDSKLKIKVFDIKRDEAKIQAIRERVLLCRKYKDELLSKLNLTA